MRGYEKRLRDLETKHEGCQQCGNLGGGKIAVQALLSPGDPLPPPCPRCGRAVVVIIEELVVVDAAAGGTP